ncbi:MAG: hypothetical protein NC485_08085 [Ruminococcus flavefaciens]|nr:hypothetical protein [Ruminococcus flavefaciens]MCM1060488.1 hypothetical protein [Eubacterium sp.]
MKKINRFAAAALAFAMATTAAGCSAPGAITIGNGTKYALTVDGYEVPAGIFINNEINAYRTAMYQIAMTNNSIPTFEEMKKLHIGTMEAEDWIQEEATETCKRFVAIEKEFDKIGGQLTQEEEVEITNYIKSLDKEFTEENGIGEESLLIAQRNTYKQNYLFKHYYGIDSERGCSEDELKQYFSDNTARIKYIAIKTTDADGAALSEDEKRELDNMIDDYIKEINSETDNQAKMQKVDEVKEEYNEYLAAQTTPAAEDGSAATTTTTTTTTTSASSDSDSTTTTTTVDPYANEVTVTKYTTTAPSEDSAVTTTQAEETEAQKAEKALNEKIFGDLPTYEAVKYQYDDDTIYILIKGDITDRLTDDDLWSEEQVLTVLTQRYGQDFIDWIKSITESYTVEKNNSAYKRYAPFKLDIEDVSLFG